MASIFQSFPIDQSLTSLSFSGYPLEFQELLIAKGNQPGSGIQNRPSGFGLKDQIPDFLKTKSNNEEEQGYDRNKRKNRRSNYTKQQIENNQENLATSIKDKFQIIINQNSDDSNTSSKSIFPPAQTFEDFMGMETEEYYKMLQGLGEKTANRNMLRAGIADLAGSPLIGGQAALEAAKNVGALTLGNMGAMAAQNRVLEVNPVKTRFAGRYFR